MTERQTRPERDDERTRIDEVAAQSTRAAFEKARREGREVLVAKEGRLVRYLANGQTRDEGPVPDLGAFMASWEARAR